MNHIVNQIHNPQLVGDNTLHVVGVISNPVRYHSRYRLYREWEEAMLKTPHVKVYTVELAFGHRHFEVTDPNNPQHLQLRTNHELWHKENMINLGVRHLLPKDWKYFCWSDTDVFWPDSNWAQESLHQLQHHPIIQPWQSCLDLGFSGQVLHTFESFCYIDRLGVKKQMHPSQPYKYAHTGFAWCATREYWENVKGLMDFAILGSADHHMAFANINQAKWTVHGGMTQGFKDSVAEWERNAYRATQGNLGFVKTRIEHKFHGPKRRRYYRERWQILIDNKYDPKTDLAYDAQGLTYLLGKPKLEAEIRGYFRARHEDSTDED